MSTTQTDELRERVLAYQKRADGGRLFMKGSTLDPEDYGPQLAVNWDNGGYHEIGCFYAGKGAREDGELLCDVFNWALDVLTPSTVGWYGERTYDD